MREAMADHPSVGRGSFRTEYRRLWRSTVDSWSTGFFFEVDPHMPEAFDWHYGMDLLPRQLCPADTVPGNALSLPAGASGRVGGSEGAC